MENTETNYTTNKTLMDYYKVNIDVHIDYLLFLNSFKGISNKSFMELAPIIESIRGKLYQAFAYDLIPDDTSHVNRMITKKLESLLDEVGLSETKDYIGEGLKEEDIINLSTAIFLKRNILEIPKANAEVTREEEKVITSTLEKMINTIPTSDIKINGYSFELASFFLESLRIKALEGKSIISYIYDYICNVNIINNMVSRIEPRAHVSCESEFLLKELYQNLSITSIFSLANLVDELNSNLLYLNKQEIKDNALAKQL